MTYGDDIFKKRSFLKSHSGWNYASKLELLYQRDTIDSKVYELLNVARNARNNMIHRGARPDIAPCKKALLGCIGLLEVICVELSKSQEVRDIKTLIARCQHYDHTGRSGKDLKPAMWRALLPIPGDEEWGDKPYPRFEEIELLPMEEELKQRVSGPGRNRA